MEPKALQQIHALNLAFNGINAAYADMAKRFDLSYNSFMVVYNLEQVEKCTQKKLCDLLTLSKSTMHSILLIFLQKGLVELQYDPSNKKERVIVPTPEGTRFFQEVCKSAHQIEHAVLKEMGEKNCDQYLALSQQYEASLKKHVKART